MTRRTINTKCFNVSFTPEMFPPCRIIQGNIFQRFEGRKYKGTSPGCAEHLGRCEKGIFPPTFSNHILKFAYGQMLTNKKNHLKFCGREATALFPSPGGLKYKGFSKFIKEKNFRCVFQLFHFKTIFQPKSDQRVGLLRSRRFF